MAEPCKILVIEDSHDAADSVVEQLRLWGHEAIAVCAALDAVSMARSFDPDVVLIDVELPANEYAVKKLRELSPDAKLVAIARFGEADFVRRSREGGFADVLLKPTAAATLKELVDTQCESRKTP